MNAYTCSSASVSSTPLCARGTWKNLFFRTKTIWLFLTGSNLRVVSAGLAGYREVWKLFNT